MSIILTILKWFIILHFVSGLFSFLFSFYVEKQVTRFGFPGLKDIIIRFVNLLALGYVSLYLIIKLYLKER